MQMAWSILGKQLKTFSKVNQLTLIEQIFLLLKAKLNTKHLNNKEDLKSAVKSDIKTI